MSLQSSEIDPGLKGGEREEIHATTQHRMHPLEVVEISVAPKGRFADSDLDRTLEARPFIPCFGGQGILASVSWLGIRSCLLHDKAEILTVSTLPNSGRSAACLWTVDLFLSFCWGS